MNPTQLKKSSWPKQAAIVISESPNVHMLLRELLRSYSWTVIDSTPSADKAIATVRMGQAFMIVCDDTPTSPVSKHLRHLLTDPIALCTPVLCFLLENNKHESQAIQRMARTAVVDKPLTPSKFVPGFLSLVRAFEKEPLTHLRRANYQFLDGNDAMGLKMLVKLNEVPAISATASQALALHLRRLGKVKEAENILLQALKKAPRELGNVLALADLYMHCAMPKLAHRLLTSVRGSYAQSLTIVPDIIQAALLMGNVDDAIANLTVLHKAGYMEEETSAFLSRLLWAEGREADAERVLSTNKAAFKRIQTGWANAEAQPLGAAG